MKMLFDFNLAVRSLAAVGMLALSAGVVQAGHITPSFDTFGTLAGATFNGTPVSSGIPNDAVAITTVDDGAGNSFKLGLTAHERFSEPDVGNDGAGTFTALSGGFSTAPSLARWNFAYYVEVLTGSVAGNTFNLLYDFDPAANTLQTALGNVDVTAAISSAAPFQDSQNLGFGFLAGTPPFPEITPPAFSTFNPNANGEYSFALIATDAQGAELGRSAILVNTVPEPATMAMFSLLTVGAAGAYRRKKRAAAAC